MSEQRINILAGVRAAYQFAPMAAPRAAAPLAISVVAGILAVVGQRLNAGLWLTPVFALTLLAGPWAYAALYRIAFEGENGLIPAPWGLAWAAPEQRALVAALLILLIVVLVTVAALFGGLLLGNVLFATVGGGKDLTLARWWLIGSAAVIVVLGLAWVLARLSLALPASVASGGVQVFTTWALTKGETIRLLAAGLLVGAPAVVMQTLVIGSAWLRGGPHDGVDLGLRAVAAAVDAGIQVPLWAGFGAYAYRMLRRPTVES